MNYQSVFKAKNRIGKGTFSTAYIKSNRVYIKSTDHAKECIALFCQGYRYLPAITRLDYLEDGTQIYTMPFYHKLDKRIHKKAYAQYKALRSIFSKHLGMSEPILHDIEKSRELLAGLKANIIRLIDMMHNYNNPENIRLEISPRNVRVTKSGRLILLDVIFDFDQLKDIVK